MAAKKVRKTKKAPSAAQIAWRKKFAAKVKAGAFKKSVKKKAVNPSSKTALTDLELRRRKLKKQAIEVSRKRWAMGTPSRAWSQTKREQYGRLKAQEREYVRRADELARQIEELKRKGNSKRNGKTIIKAKRVTILNLKKNPAFAIHKTLKATKRGNQAGWLLGTKFYAKSRGQKALPGGSVLDLNSGLVYQRVENPKKNFSLFGRKKAQKTESPHSSLKRKIIRHIEAGFSTTELKERLGDEPGYRAAYTAARKATKGRRKKNVQMMGGGGAFPIRASADYDPVKAGESPSRKSAAAQKRTRKATQKKIKAAGGVKKYVSKIKTRKAATRKASQSRRMTATTKQRKATTTRLASRLLDRSGPKKTRRNPFQKKRYNVKVKFQKDPNYYNYKLGDFWSKAEAAAAANARIGTVIDGQSVIKASPVDTGIVTATQKTVGESMRNPNTATKSAYESFQGKPSNKSTSLNFPNGTPANVYKLGTLHSITLQSGAVVKPASKTVWLCADTKGKLHLGTSGERLVNAPKGALGKVKEVEYITTKPHLGDNRPTRYYHELGEETGQKPTLYSDGAGGLVFKGGATYVRSDGIHN